MSKKLHTVQSSDKKEFDKLVNDGLENGFEILENGYSQSGDLFIQKMVKRDKSEDKVFEGTYFFTTIRGSKNHGLFWSIRPEDGLEDERGYYQFDKKYGLWVTKDLDYNRVDYVNYRDDKKDGLTQNYRDGQIWNEGFYSEGRKIGMWITLLGEGVESDEFEVTHYDGHGNGSYTTHYGFNENNVFQELRDNYKNFGISGEGNVYLKYSGLDEYEYDGEQIRYHKSGEWEGHIKLRYNYEFGKLNGEYIEYYNNDSVKSITTYSNNYRDGTFEEFYKNGQVKIRGTIEYRNSTINNEPLDVDSLDSREILDYMENSTGSYVEEDSYIINKWFWYKEDGDIIRTLDYGKYGEKLKECDDIGKWVDWKQEMLK